MYKAFDSDSSGVEIVVCEDTLIEPVPEIVVQLVFGGMGANAGLVEQHPGQEDQQTAAEKLAFEHGTSQGKKLLRADRDWSAGNVDANNDFLTDRNRSPQSCSSIRGPH
jgi:hypothetical protein